MFIDIIIAQANPSAWAQTLSHMFSLDDTATWAEKILRPVIVYLTLIILLRIFGKRELAQLNPLDLIVILSLSNTVQNAIIGQDNSLVGGLAGAAALLAINGTISYIKFRNRSVEKFVDGDPVTLIEKGKIDQARLRREHITEADIDIIAHENGLAGHTDIEKLIIDPNGSFLVDGKDEIKDAKFKREVLKKLADLTKQMNELSAALQK